MTQDMFQWSTLVNTVMNLGVPFKKWGISASQKRLCSMGLVPVVPTHHSDDGGSKRL
jgi:hypothetical protein